MALRGLNRARARKLGPSSLVKLCITSAITNMRFASNCILRNVGRRPSSATSISWVTSVVSADKSHFGQGWQVYQLCPFCCHGHAVTCNAASAASFTVPCLMSAKGVVNSSARLFFTECDTFLWRQVRSCSATHAGVHLQDCMFDTVPRLTSSFNLCGDRSVCIRQHTAGVHLQALIFDLGVSRGDYRAVVYIEPSGMIIFIVVVTMRAVQLFSGSGAHLQWFLVLPLP